MNHIPEPGINSDNARSTTFVESYGSTAAIAGMWKKAKRSRVHRTNRYRKNAIRLCSNVRHGAASGPATKSPEARKNSGMRIDARAVLAATTVGGASPCVCMKLTEWCATTRRIDRPFAASTHATREEPRTAGGDRGELC